VKRYTTRPRHDASIAAVECASTHSLIQFQFPEEETELDPLTQARAYHESFIESHARSFVGRSKILQEIHNYTESVLHCPAPFVCRS
jgi:hypothetical protein